MTSFSAQFAERLGTLLAQKHISQSQLAQRLGVSRSTVTGWLRYGKLPDAELIANICKTLECRADWLLGLLAQDERQNQSGTIRWVEQIPPYVPDFQREQIEYGIRLFNLLMLENASNTEIKNNPQYVRSALQTVLRSGAIRLTHVARNSTLEERLKTAYPLKDVIVAEVPELYEDTLLRTEFVAFLGATEALTRIIRQSAVGLGVGYTLLRLCENSIPSADQFNGTRWTPLVAFKRQNIPDYAPNYLARLMSTRHPGSQALYLPDEETHQAMRNMQTVFVSVSGIKRHPSGKDKSYPFSEFRSADYEVESAALRAEYEKVADSFGGELLRYLLNERGEVIGRDPSVGAQIDLDILRYTTEMVGTVYVVAACSFKARAVRTCIENGLANALVIDSEIAAYLH